ncbi:uncharacterized protein LOC129771737 [Toxorhynchites rutilus septentrionalis]|uniref:uncharacterized protein LOC129771737 n=1 Tax=Toxorhynchites rutilus septentrionalis TaxID=329112 RepID=UPI0024787744|nr:uncharacterized protein LOC129771737 [Toxorhynchites rutilus septentrionalis]
MEKPILGTNEELRPCHVHYEMIKPLIIFERFSNWNRLLRSMAFVFHVSTAQKARKNSVKVEFEVTHEDLRAAENQILKMVQCSSYPEEMTIMSININAACGEQRPLDKSSSLFKLTPMLDDEGILRIDSRTGAARVDSYDVKYPIILPRKHYVTYLIVDNYHRKFLHGNAETVVNELRQRYYISRMRVVVRAVSRSCQWCKVYKSQPTIPKMGPLPEARLSPGVRPFSFVGIDYFGPILVKVGRANAKRWVCLITCLTIRAVHVEVARDLSTPSCIECIRRFVDRRGAPLEIYSDNGRNFVGANGVLRQQINKIDEEVAATFTNTRTKWYFIPPASPHMGGSWERLVRSIKVAITSIPQNNKLDDFALWTLVVDAEAIVNCRPLTYLPLDSPEQEALTPNHFLLGSSRGVKQPSIKLGRSDKTISNTWTIIQNDLDHFWKCWVREYLPTLTRRTKWFGDVKPVGVGDMVILIDDKKRNGWVRGRVLDVTKGKDGRVRQAVVQTTDGLFRRPVSKLAVLDLCRNSNAGVNTQPYGEGDVDDSAPHLATLPLSVPLTG